MNIIGKLAGGQTVVDRYNSHLHESVRAILPEALSRVSLDGDQFAVRQVNFPNVIGENVCVETTSTDNIIYAQRPRRGGLTRFVENRPAEPSNSAVVILKKAEDNPLAYILITAFIGEIAEPEPWDRNATPKSKEFWASHALVWGSEEIVPGTETYDHPW